MLKFVKKVLKLNSQEKKDAGNFFDFPSHKQKKILNEAVREANKDQLELVKKYDKAGHQDFDFRKC